MSTTAAETASSVESFRVVPNPAPASDSQREAALAEMSFGKQFTDHMARVTWTAEGGWADRRVEAYGPLTLDPASAVLHYGQEVFEGLKAFRWADGSVWVFRPEANAARLVALRVAPRAAGTAGRGLHRGDRGPGARRFGVGAGRRGVVAVFAAVHVRA